MGLTTASDWRELQDWSMLSLLVHHMFITDVELLLLCC